MQATEELVAGRELDALVAEKVMGLKPCSDPTGRCDAAKMTPCQCWGTGRGGSDLDLYSTDIAAAWQVVERMRELMWGMVIWNSWPLSSAGRGLAVRFYQGVYPPSYKDGEWFEGGEAGRHCPLAICRAAIAAVSRP